jgi:putative transposase
VAGRTGQEYNQRKSRKGAYWEDNYHATVIEDGEHLLRCIVYIDMNMVRAGVVEHSAQWKHAGYNEIQSPRRKNILIEYQTLMRLTGFEAYEKFQAAHRRWVQAAVDKANLIRESHWTQSIAVGSETFVTAVKKQMHHLAKGRLIRSSTEFCELRDPEASYIGHFEAQKGDIGLKNTLLWNESD